MKRLIFLIFTLACCACVNQKEIQNDLPSNCVSIERMDGNYLVLDKVNILLISVNGIPLNELEAKISNGEIISFENGICKIIIHDSVKTQLFLYKKGSDIPLIVKEFRIVS